MKTIIKSPLIYLLLIIGACNNSHPKIEKLDKSSSHQYVSNLSFKDGKYKIDTIAILNNNNLSTFIDMLEHADLEEKPSIDKIPAFIKLFLDSLSDGFLIANPNENWNAGCTSVTMINDKGKVISETLPKRQLRYFGNSADLALMIYDKGGFVCSTQVLIIQFKDDKILDIWINSSVNQLKNKSDVLKYLHEQNTGESKLKSDFISF